MSIGAALLLELGLLVLGIAVGAWLRSGQAGARAAGGILAVFVLCGVLTLPVVLLSDPFQDGGTIPEYHAEKVLGAPLALARFVCALGLFYLGPLPIGFAIGTALVFRHERHGWIRLLAAFLAAPAVFVGSLWIMTLG
jgi:hypothetical protein